MRPTQPSSSSTQARVATTQKGAVAVCRRADRAATAPLTTRQAAETVAKTALATSAGRKPYGLSETSHVDGVQGGDGSMSTMILLQTEECGYKGGRERGGGDGSRCDADRFGHQDGQQSRAMLNK